MSSNLTLWVWIKTGRNIVRLAILAVAAAVLSSMFAAVAWSHRLPELDSVCNCQECELVACSSRDKIAAYVSDESRSSSCRLSMLIRTLKTAHHRGISFRQLAFHGAIPDSWLDLATVYSCDVYFGPAVYPPGCKEIVIEPKSLISNSVRVTFLIFPEPQDLRHPQALTREMEIASIPGQVHSIEIRDCIRRLPCTWLPGTQSACDFFGVNAEETRILNIGASL